MSDSINIIQREERIQVKPASYSITVVNTGPQGPMGPVNPNAGTPVISGLATRSLAATVISSNASGIIIRLDPGASGQAYLNKVGNDVEHVYDTAQGWMSYKYKINVQGLYHINGHVQHNGNSNIAPAGSVIGVRINEIAVRRQTLRISMWETVNITFADYLNVGDTVSLFGYTTGGSWGTSIQATQTALDGYSPRLDVWRFGGAL